MEYDRTGLDNYIINNPELIKRVSGFLLMPEEVIIYIGKTHIGVEYIGSEIIQEQESDKVIQELKSIKEIKVHDYDYSIEETDLFEQIIGFEYETTSDLVFPLLPLNENLLLPTNKSWHTLRELGWNIDAANSIIGINTPLPKLIPNQFTRIVNGLFFDSNDSGLKSRHIKWLDFFPIIFDEEKDSISFSLDGIQKLVEPDAHYIYPMPDADDFKFNKLPKINRFIEVWGNLESSEPDITSHLAKIENQFILTMKFGATKVYSELICEWQSENRDSIKPDFFVVQPNGYADIVEFKRPSIDKNFIVGIANRESFSAWLTSYISQTRVYAIYFDDPNNRKWFEDKYGFKVHKPRRWLIVGRRSDFGSDVWREIMHDYKDLEIMTFDDLIDGVVVQFYKT